MSETVTSPVPEEVFDEFRASRWPEMFGGTAHHSRVMGTPLDRGIEAFEISLILAPDKERNVLEAMGIVEDPYSGSPMGETYFRRFTAFGRQVVAACEGLYTDEDYEQR